MAIYTQYGRYLKAKMFKDMLDGPGPCEAYMVLGMGNPFWDLPEANQPMPIAPFNSNVLTSPGATENQFYDNFVNLSYTVEDSECIDGMINGIPSANTFIEKCKYILPPVPGIWPNQGNENLLTTDESYILTQNNWASAYILKDGSDYKLYAPENNTVAYRGNVILHETDNHIQEQIFAELYIRGLATSFEYPAAGLLGAVKCKVDFVKDIGGIENYTGDIDEFFYGDRYWKIVTDNEEQLIAKGEYPHHLRFTSTINLRNLCPDVNIDQYLVPRQLAIYARKKEVDDEHPTSGSGANTSINYKPGKSFYRVGENVFDFGQYNEVNELPDPPAGGKVLHFTLPVTVNGYTYTDGDFKFLLNDYIHGHIREPHSVDRFGYIVGF